MSKNGEIYTAGKNFTLPPALTAWTNSTSAYHIGKFCKSHPVSKLDSLSAVKFAILQHFEKLRSR